MLHFIYAQPPLLIIFLMTTALALWGCLAAKFHMTLRWQRENLILSILMAIAVLYTTILSRSEGNTGLVLTPFAAIAAARQQPELYREMLMNVFLFFPLGLTLSNALPQPWRCWRRIAITVAFGCILSAGIEFAQYRFSLGMAEMDDVICNTLGAFIGATSLLLSHAVEIIRKGPKT